MAGILRGDIRWTELDPTRGNEQQGTRPVLVISHDVFNERARTVVAMSIRSQPQKAGFPLTLPLSKIGGKDAWLKIRQVRVLSSLRLGKKQVELRPSFSHTR
jgi:mRNA interferase MazF